MTFTEATKNAPADADFIKYTGAYGTVYILMRRSDGVWFGIAETNREGASFVAAGISASRKSLWDADAGEFLPTQLMEEATRKSDIVANLTEVRLEISRLNRDAGETRFNPAATSGLDAVLRQLGTD